ncbi:MAG: ribonuclease HII [Nitrospira sp.]|nr:ribonuclease HII [Nitrospira sp.]
MDEAGRGCLAGPVVAASVILPPDISIKGVDDSKKMSPAKRESLFELITRHSVRIGIGIVWNEDIDRINILNATIEAMETAVRDLKFPPDYLLIDAVSLSSLDIPQLPIIRGDTLSASIASASIIAKVTRDRLMAEQHNLFPQYNFLSHKGYGTKEHFERIRMFGPSVIHRRSFLRKMGY